MWQYYNIDLLADLTEHSWMTLQEKSFDRVLEQVLNSRNLNCVTEDDIRVMVGIMFHEYNITRKGWHKTSNSTFNRLELENDVSPSGILICPEGVFTYQKNQRSRAFPPKPTTRLMRNYIFWYLHHKALIDMKRIQSNAWICKGSELDVFKEICKLYKLKNMEDYIPFEFR